MEVRFLGTSHGRPDNGRHCSSTMIEMGDSIYLVDAGAPVTDCLFFLGKDITKIKGIFITHVHSDHLDGLLFLLNTIVGRRADAKFKVFLPNEELHKIIISYVETLSHTQFPIDKIEFTEPTEGEIFSDQNITVEYFMTKHIEKSYGLVIKGEGKALVFTGDMSGGLRGEDFPEYAINNHTDLVVCEMAHFEMSDLEKYIEKLDTEKLCINHINRLSKYDDVKRVNDSKKYSFPIIAVNDNDLIEI